jgi:PAS domain S-box-containing protein
MDRDHESPVEAGLRRWSIAGMVAGVFLAALGGVSSWQNMRRAAESDDWVAHTHALNAALEVVLADVVEVESGSWGFAATGNAVFLEPFEAGRRTLPDDLNTIAALTYDNPSQQEQLQKLRPEIEARLAAAENTVAERLQTGSVPSAAVFLLGKQRMDAVRATISEMQAEESRLLERRIASAENARQRTVTATLLTTVAAVCLLLFAGVVTRREIKRSEKMRAQVEALNAELENGVAARTVELHESQEQFRGIIDSAMDAIIAIDENQRIVIFNDAAETAFLCPQRDAIGQPLDRFLPQRFRAALAMDVDKFARSGLTRRQMGYMQCLLGLRSDGSEFSSLPVPVSPRMSTVTSVRATISICFRTWRKAKLCPTSSQDVPPGLP